jgi:hypothetical protein
VLCLGSGNRDARSRLSAIRSLLETLKRRQLVIACNWSGIPVKGEAAGYCMQLEWNTCQRGGTGEASESLPVGKQYAELKSGGYLVEIDFGKMSRFGLRKYGNCYSASIT